MAQQLPLIEHFKRHAEGLWFIAASVQEMERNVEVASIDCLLHINEVYDRVRFPDALAETGEDKPVS